jgi:type I restriction enzyme S subunit
MGWEQGTIRDIIAEVQYGTSKPAGDGGRYPYLRKGNITYDGQLDLSDLKYIDIQDSDLEKYIVRNGDVLFNRTNSKEIVGKTCVFNINEHMDNAGYIIRIRLNDKAIPIYLSAVLNSYYGKLTLQAMCKTIIGQANINAQELQGIRILIPPLRLQNRFAAFVQQVDKTKFVMRSILDNMLTLCFNGVEDRG